MDIYTEIDESVNAMWPVCAYQKYETCPVTKGDGDNGNEAEEGGGKEKKNKEGGNTINNSQQHDDHDDDDKSAFAVN